MFVGAGFIPISPDVDWLSKKLWSNCVVCNIMIGTKTTDNNFALVEYRSLHQITLLQPIGICLCTVHLFSAFFASLRFLLEIFSIYICFCFLMFITSIKRHWYSSYSCRIQNMLILLGKKQAWFHSDFYELSQLFSKSLLLKFIGNV